MKRIGLLGGSFDPIHLAHVALARTARDYLRLDHVQLLPAQQPWQKPDLSATAEQRLAMVRLATENEVGIDVNPMELQRPGKTYTIDTLEKLPPNCQYFWLLGADQLQNFCTWHRWQDVSRLVTLAAATRPGSKLQIPPPLSQRIASGEAKLELLPFDPIDVSSSQLRAALVKGDNVSLWLHPNVENYIRQHGLYRHIETD